MQDLSIGGYSELDLSREIRASLEFTEIKLDCESHLEVNDNTRCRNKCKTKPCTYICPSQVYSWQNDTIKIDYARCVECGACQEVCPENIRWNYPRGGYGIAWRY